MSNKLTLKSRINICILSLCVIFWCLFLNYFIPHWLFGVLSVLAGLIFGWHITPAIRDYSKDET